MICKIASIIANNYRSILTTVIIIESLILLYISI